VLAETVPGGEGKPLPATLELLTKARALAGPGSVEVWCWGPDSASAAASLGAYGATKVYDVGDTGAGLPGVPVAAAMAAAMAAAVTGGSVPDAVLFPMTYDGRDTAGRLSARLDRTVLSNTLTIETDGDGLRVGSAIFGGSLNVEATFTGPKPWLILVRAKSFAAEESGGGPPPVERAVVPDTGATGAAVVKERHVEEREGPKLDEANVVVSGGRGLGEAGKYAMIEELAKLLGGAAGASRAIVDAGWVPYSHQVGQTGKTVKPSVYIACGISGATQHLVGMKGAKNIIAVNKDSEAPIFSVADLGVVGDVHKVLPKLIEALRSRA